jgi:hypothetical protein
MIKLIAYFRIKDSVDMKEKLEGIKNIMHTGYGAWTIMNFFFYYRITMDCKD